MPEIQLVECPRDAMQGLHDFVPTTKKLELLKALMQCGFHTIDAASFVSAKSIPQLADSPEVMEALLAVKKTSETLVIVANERGAENALKHKNVDYLGFPFSISETFQQRNTNASREEAFVRLQNIVQLSNAANRKMVVYLSMAFGNPYEDKYDNIEILDWIARINELGIRIISLADTIGTAKQKDIEFLFDQSISKYAGINFGAHFHAKPLEGLQKIEPAFYHGCRRFDAAILGKGGCPFASDELTGNIPTEQLLPWLNSKGDTGINMDAFYKAVETATRVYGMLN